MNALLVGARIAHLLAAIVLFGSFVFAVVVAPAAMHADAHGNALAWSRLYRRLRSIVRVSLAIAVISAVLWFVIDAVLIGGSSSLDTFGRVALQTAFGRAWSWRFAIALVLAALLVYESRAATAHRRWIGIGTTLFAGVYLATIAYAGHAAAGDAGDRYVRIGSDVAHLIAAGAWLGVLPGLVLLLRAARSTGATASIDVATAAAQRFSSLGIASVAVLVASGIANAWFLIGDVPHLIGTEYGRLLMLKVAVFVAMLTLAAVNRIRLTPRIAARDFVALRALMRNATTECGLGILVVAIVGVLGVTVPGAHEAPVWPLSFAVHVEPVETAGAAGWFVAIAITVLCAVGALAIAQQQRQPIGGWRIATATAVVLLASVLTSPYFSIAPAYPTTYAVPAVRYTTHAIAQGRALYADNCAQCHGLHGRGDGPLAASLANKPPDLVVHSAHHLEGDMFWWIAHGIPGTAMPPFAPRLDDPSIWSLIEFLRAQAAASDALALTQRVEPWRGIAAPDFIFELPSQGQASLRDQRGHHNVLLVLYTMPLSLDRLQMLASDERRLASAGVRVIAVPIIGASPATDQLPAMQSIAALADADVGAVYAMLAASDEDAIGGPAPFHVEFLIDRQGYVRARWLNVPADGKKQTMAIVAQAAALNAEPPREAAPDAHMH